MTCSSMKIISGGQSGVDLAALRAAQLLGYATGGIAPRAWKTQLGQQPSLASFGLRQSISGYAGRTEENIIISDATLLIYVNGASAGTNLTRKVCKLHERPCLEVDLTKPVHVADVSNWLKAQHTSATVLTGSSIINVAGNSSTTAPGIFQGAFGLLLHVLKPLISGPTEKDDADRANVFAQFSHPQQQAMIADRFEYIPQLDFKNRFNTLPIEGSTRVLDA